MLSKQTTGISDKQVINWCSQWQRRKRWMVVTEDLVPAVDSVVASLAQPQPRKSC